jgi:hypothetical protein
MPNFNSFLNWGPVSRVRRNHGLEHATLQVLAERNPKMRAAGYSDVNGFWLLGDVETPEVEEAVNQALTRLNAGESHLAVHPNCGTNLVTTGFLAGSFAWLGMIGTGRSFRDKFERWPFIITLVTLGVMIAQPLGPFIQSRVTTSPASAGLRVKNIEKVKRGEMPVHRILTTS